MSDDEYDDDIYVEEEKEEEVLEEEDDALDEDVEDDDEDIEDEEDESDNYDDDNTLEEEKEEKEDKNEILFKKFELISKQLFNEARPFFKIAITDKNIDTFIKLIHNNILEYNENDYEICTTEILNNVLECFCEPEKYLKKFMIELKDLKKHLFDLLNDTNNFYEWVYENNENYIKMCIKNIKNSNKTECKEGLYTCKKCKSKKIMERQLQLRSQDEPMTSILSCLSCGAGWREG